MNNVPKTAVHRILTKDLSFSKVYAKMVHKMLTDRTKAQSLETCQDLPQEQNFNSQYYCEVLY